MKICTKEKSMMLKIMKKTFLKQRNGNNEAVFKHYRTLGYRDAECVQSSVFKTSTYCS